MADSKAENHWYIQLKDVKVPEVAYRDLSGKNKSTYFDSAFLVNLTRAGGCTPSRARIETSPGSDYF
jgi:hypothetical protein